jgi:hypothetical protein
MSTLYHVVIAAEPPSLSSGLYIERDEDGSPCVCVSPGDPLEIGPAEVLRREITDLYGHRKSFTLEPAK